MHYTVLKLKMQAIFHGVPRKKGCQPKRHTEGDVLNKKSVSFSYKHVLIITNHAESINCQPDGKPTQ